MVDFRCSFCGREHKAVKHLVSGPLVFICDACHASAHERRQQIVKCSFCGPFEGERAGLRSAREDTRKDFFADLDGLTAAQASETMRATICDRCLELTRDIIDKREVQRRGAGG